MINLFLGMAIGFSLGVALCIIVTAISQPDFEFDDFLEDRAAKRDVCE